eukprot:TRINITY_DN96_c0_g1_i1.p1 TRINITY_DN96_c0_g1~~TRINITY_DN96_c0_g1_i1.p1  ORF type:complete len:559 (-),score=135.11 TRINITY_DN96_c0_g1_i1:111-1748(-)
MPLKADNITIEIQNQAGTAWENAKNYYANEGPKVRFMAVYIFANIFYFAYVHSFYASGNGVVHGIDHGLLHRELGEGVAIARGCGALLRMNSILLLVPMLRNTLRFLRETFLNELIPIDKGVAFHKKVGWWIAVLSFVHTIAHCFNIWNMSRHNQSLVLNPDRLNLIQHHEFSDVPTLEYWETSIPGITGFILIIVMVFMYSTAYRALRRPYFEAFWYTHHLFIVYYAMLLIHGTAGYFEPAAFWKWFAGPGALYALERLIRWYRGTKNTILVDAIAHKGDVVEIRFSSKGFSYKCGQYLFVNCPFISENEWHPFTITSCPSDPYVSCHIRMVGDWTKEFGNLLLKSEYRDNILATSELDGMPIVRIDGPFGSAADKCVTDYKVAVLIAAGIGVTPFASILKEIRYRHTVGKNTPLNKAYFVWSARERGAFAWFAGLLAEFEVEEKAGFLEVMTFLTAPMKQDDIRKIVYDDSEKGDAVTGLETATNFGRPNFDQILRRVSSENKGETIGVFFCGPRALANDIRDTCRHLHAELGTTFSFNKENF